MSSILLALCVRISFWELSHKHTASFRGCGVSGRRCSLCGFVRAGGGVESEHCRIPHAGMWEGSAGGMRRNPEWSPSTTIIAPTFSAEKNWRGTTFQQTPLHLDTFNKTREWKREDFYLTIMASLKTLLYLGIFLSARRMTNAGKTTKIETKGVGWHRQRAYAHIPEYTTI